MKYKVRIVRSLQDLSALRLEEAGRLVADVETFGTEPADGKLLGVALAPLDGKFADGSDAAYVVVQEYLYRTSVWNGVIDCSIAAALALPLSSQLLVGFNYCYDRAWLDHFFEITTNWLDHFFEITTNWHADARLMWHISSPADRTRSYGLKDAQVEVLGWPARGDAELEEQVEARGGKLRNGDHYLADTDVLGRYAGLDAISTAQLYMATREHFDRHDQWGLLDRMMTYSRLIDDNTRAGVRVDESKLSSIVANLTAELPLAHQRFVDSVAPHIAKLEEEWRSHQAAKYAADSYRAKFLSDPARWKRFKPSSDKQKKELFYDVLGLPVVQTVKPRKDKKTGERIYSDSPSSGVDAVVAAVSASGRTDLGEMLEAFQRAEHIETMLKNFASPWLKSLRRRDGVTRIHPRFNPCGTLSYRLSGYKPQFLNLPFEERELMSCFSCDEGWTGVHADLVSIEPAVTAHYSQDPSLLKVFRDGLGDVYLDLALTLFPRYAKPFRRAAYVATRYSGNDNRQDEPFYVPQAEETAQEYERRLTEWQQVEDLHDFYDTNAPITSAVKERFKQQRKVAKIVQLAVQYTGTKYTVHLSLSKAGWQGTLDDADRLVQGYWRHFERVGRMNAAIQTLHERRGFLKNVVGRVIRVSRRNDKDLPNKLVQSSAHDILSLWVLRIYELCAEREITVRPMLIDSHDATSNQSPEPDRLEQAYRDALADVQAQVRLSVPIRADIKRFHTFAGLKGAE